MQAERGKPGNCPRQAAGLQGCGSERSRPPLIDHAAGLYGWGFGALIHRHWIRLLCCAAACGAQAFDYEFKGEAQAWSLAYRPDTEPNPDAFFEASVRPGLTLFFSDYWLFHTKGVARWDTESYATGVMDHFVEDERRYAVGVPEYYFEFNREQWRLRLGKQQLDWSVTDTVSPSDFLNGRDWTDILEWERVGTQAFDVRYGKDAYVELVLAAFTPSKLPAERWQPALPPGATFGTADDGARGEPQTAARGAVLVRGFEVGAAAFHGYSYGPSLEVNPVGPSAIQLTPVYRRQSAFATFLTGEVYQQVILRAELGYFIQEQDDDFVQGVVGLERQWNGLFSGTDQLTVTVQYTQEFETRNVRGDPYKRLDLRRAFDNSAFWQFRYAFDDRERWSLRMRGAYSFHDQGHWLEPAAVWSHHRFSTTLGLDILSGPSDSFWGGFSQQDRLFIKLNYFF